MGSFGVLLHGPIGHYWYGFLDRSIMTKAPTSALAVTSKTAIDQILWAPIFTSGFFAYMKTADGKASEIPEEVQSKLWDTMKVNWMTWIPGTWPRLALRGFVVVKVEYLVAGLMITRRWWRVGGRCLLGQDDGRSVLTCFLLASRNWVVSLPLVACGLCLRTCELGHACLLGQQLIL